ncbi:endonuclease [Candidatus Kaiserbacteria bacterium CG10_big_fil_rev_8_21_14_0_10_56_12]|uniref:Endonuclease n=1 Tax=Candidatus Kaiserbacteria bacterium CG10_big_fil_rev_8_21_14_0_10_56_12 TaxID=1974611 RepID=A0A2H0U9C8_9BACT|nr:MAG: endonuclease [Candidatus Kaiserbacteria bacterium CG10_big_fil_rev_8_21_14_0_10_56_12]
MTQHLVYILECGDGSLYTGYTTDLVKRIDEHNNSTRGARYTSGRRPVVLKHHERYASRGAALSREAEIKRLSRAAKLALCCD